MAQDRKSTSFHSLHNQPHRTTGSTIYSTLPPNWPGHFYLSSTRPSVPPNELPYPPPKLFRAAQQADIRRGGIVPLDAKARPRMVPREALKLDAEGWTPPEVEIWGVGNGEGSKELPRVQFEFEEVEADAKREKEVEERFEWVKRAFVHVWEGYKKDAWGHDELHPLNSVTSFGDPYNGFGASIVDTLDTLLILNLTTEYDYAREHVRAIDFTYIVAHNASCFSTTKPPLEVFDNPISRPKQYCDPQESIPYFETTIRYLGGLISAYELSHDQLMLDRATELGDWLLPALGTKYGLPRGWYEMGFNPDGVAVGESSLAEVGSLQMEFTRLSMLTGDETYFRAVQRTTDTLDTRFASADMEGSKRLGTLLPRYINPDSPNDLRGVHSFGSIADSYYEYLIKMYQLTGGVLTQYGRMYQEAIDSAKEHLLRPVEVVPGWNNLTVLGIMISLAVRPEGWLAELEHLTCFAGGMLQLGSKLLERPEDIEYGVNLTNTCAWAYDATATGVGPEIITFFEPNDPARFKKEQFQLEDGTLETVDVPLGVPVGAKSTDNKAMGRPETIESVFYSYRITGDPYWQDVGWEMFTNWVGASIVESGFATIADVNNADAGLVDELQSFVFAESFKYYALLFSPPDFFSLDDWVFNTEAHPMRVAKPSPIAFQPLWSGESSIEEGDVVGEGTSVQQWARIQQASGWWLPEPETELELEGGGNEE